MAEPTLAEVFGANATQNATTLTIVKSDFANLTALASNTAESLALALIQYWLTNLTETNRANDTVNRNITTVDPVVDLIQEGTTFYNRFIYSILVYKATTQPTLDPDDV